MVLRTGQVDIRRASKGAHSRYGGIAHAYPGPWISRELDDRVRKTAMVRSVFTREHEGYLRIWRHGIDEAKAYARQNAASYLRFQSFWPKIMDGLWRDAQLISILEGAE